MTDKNIRFGYGIEIAGGAPSNSVLTRRVTRARAHPNWISEIAHEFNGAPIARRVGDYDFIGRKTKVRAIGAASHTNAYTYNKRSEIATANYTGVLGADHKFNYDGIGNLTSGYISNELNQYTEIKRWNLPPCYPEYDVDGSLISNDEFEYKWDSEGRLAAVYSSGACLVSNAYDHAGRRIIKTTFNATSHQPLTTSHFIYDGWNPILEIIAYDSGATTTNRYFWGLDLSGTPQGAGGVGGLVAVSLNGALYFTLADSNGNITEYIDANGAIVAQYSYGDFGDTRAESGVNATIYYDGDLHGGIGKASILRKIFQLPNMS